MTKLLTAKRTVRAAWRARLPLTGDTDPMPTLYLPSLTLTLSVSLTSQPLDTSSSSLRVMKSNKTRGECPALLNTVWSASREKSSAHVVNPNVHPRRMQQTPISTQQTPYHVLLTLNARGDRPTDVRLVDERDREPLRRRYAPARRHLVGVGLHQIRDHIVRVVPRDLQPQLPALQRAVARVVNMRLVSQNISWALVYNAVCCACMLCMLCMLCANHKKKTCTNHVDAVSPSVNAGERCSLWEFPGSGSEETRGTVPVHCSG